MIISPNKIKTNIQAIDSTSPSKIPKGHSRVTDVPITDRTKHWKQAPKSKSTQEESLTSTAYYTDVSKMHVEWYRQDGAPVKPH